MRSRNIKPGFFKNEYLSELSAYARLLFVGLPLLADREGRLKYRPKQIKAELLPYDEVDVEALLHELNNACDNFLVIYEIDSNKYIQITNFVKHQKPHKQEKDSEIPPPQDSSNYREISRQVPDSVEKKSEPVALNDERGMMNDDSLLLNDEPKTPPSPKGEFCVDEEKKYSEAFEKCWAIYPKKTKKHYSSEAFKRYRLAEHVDLVVASIEAHNKTEQWQKEGGKYAPDFSTFISRKQWLDKPEPGGNGIHKNMKPLHLRLFEAGKAYNPAPIGDEPERINLSDWIHVPKGYFGTEDGLQHKQTGQILPMNNYRPIKG